MIYVPQASTIRKVPFLVVLVAFADFLGLNLNHKVTAQRSDSSRSTEAQPGITLDDQFAAIARVVHSFGGLFIRDGQLNVYLTNPADLQAAMLAIQSVFGRTDLPLDNPVALQGRFNFAQLKAWHDLHRPTTLATTGVQSVDIDERNNRLQIDVLTYQAQSDVRVQLESLRIPAEAFNISLAQPAPLVGEGPGHLAKASPRAMPVLNGPGLQDKQRPVAGGIQIKSADAGICTLSFLAVRQGDAGFITCSHCTKTSGVVESTVINQALIGDTNRIGFETADPPFFTGGKCPSNRMCRYSDTAFIKRDSTKKQWIPLTPGDFGSLLIPTFTTTDSDQAYLSPLVKHDIVALADNPPVSGVVLEKTGRTTGRTVGEVTGTCLDQNVLNMVNGNQVDTGLTMLCQDKVAALALPGDSGSPVYKMTSKPDGTPAVKLFGIAWTSNGQETWFSSILQMTRDTELGNLKIHNGQNPDSKPEVKILKPTDGSPLPLGQSVTLQAAAVDFEDATLNFTWTSLDDNITMGYGASLPYVFSTPGLRHIRVTAKDSDNHAATYDITVTVAQNTPPTVTIVAPTPNKVFHIGESTGLTGNSSDPNEPGGALPCSSLYWTYKATYGISIPGSAGSGCSLPFFKFSSAGDYTIVLTGTDSMGAKGYATVNVKVVEPGTPTAYITGPTDEALYADQKATLKGY
jgi:hypothetical protein